MITGCRPLSDAIGGQRNIVVAIDQPIVEGESQNGLRPEMEAGLTALQTPITLSGARDMDVSPC